MTWAGSGLVFALGVTLWLAGSLRERKRVEAALRQSEERFRSLANTAPVMIVASHSDGQATFFNKTWLDFTGRTMEQELGYGWIESVHPDDRDHTRVKYEQSLRRARIAALNIACEGRRRIPACDLQRRSPF